MSDEKVPVLEIATNDTHMLVAPETECDRRDMLRMGKTQELRRNFGYFSIFGLTMVLMATWEAQLTANIFGLINGGTGGLIWMYIGTFIGFFAAVVSMAEMASMAPTTGGQYHWVSEFAPPSLQRFSSYIIGWLCVLGWQTATVAILFPAANQISALAILNNENYQPEHWHISAILIALVTFAQVFNTFFAHKLPLVESGALILHLVGFVAILVPLWVLGTPGDAREVFTMFSDGGGWGSIGLSTLIGMLSPIFSFIGPDSAVHLAEECTDASRTLPRVMLATTLVNGALGFVMLVTFCMLAGNVEEILDTKTGQPFIQMFYNITQSHAGTSVMASILIIVSVFGCVANVAAASRQIWAFARDKGMPFSGWLAHVRPGWDIPLNAVMVSYTIAVLLSLVNIGSDIAFNVISSLGVGALLSSYIVSISCITLKRLRGEELIRSSFSLGRAGLPINIFSVLFLVLAFVLAFFPQSPHPEAKDMNWSIVVYGAVVLFSMVYFAVWGRKKYLGPVVYVRKDW